MRIVTAAAFSLLVLVSAASSRAAILQYEGSSNVLPDDPSWNWGYEAIPFASATASGGVTTLDTTLSNTIHAGYTTHIPDLSSTSFTHDSSIPLNAATGFEVDFTVKLLSESHASNDRAGFSVIALSNSGPALGIELGFWQDEVWAQNADFTHSSESAMFDTTAALTNYQLEISGNTYTLLANSSPLLTGNLRDYSAFNSGIPTHPHFPYDQPNFLFFGDDTSSAQGSVQISELLVVPEPAAMVLAAIGITMLGVIIAIRR